MESDVIDYGVHVRLDSSSLNINHWYILLNTATELKCWGSCKLLHSAPDIPMVVMWSSDSFLICVCRAVYNFSMVPHPLGVSMGCIRLHTYKPHLQPQEYNHEMVLVTAVVLGVCPSWIITIITLQESYVTKQFNNYGWSRAPCKWSWHNLIIIHFRICSQLPKHASLL